MKKLVLFFVVVVLPFIVFAQKDTYRDVVELKNGAVIKGTIIEHIPNQYVKIKVPGEVVFVYQMDEVSKLRKETITKTNQNRNIDKGYMGISGGMSVPLGSRTKHSINGFTFSLVDFGYRFSSRIGMAGKGIVNIYKKGDFSLLSGGLMIGALGIYPITKSGELINRILVGFEKGTLGYYEENEGNKRETFTGLTYDLGIGIKINSKGDLAFLVNFDYVKITYFNNINITFGIAYRL